MEKVESFMAEVRRYVVARKTEIYELGTLQLQSVSREHASPSANPYPYP
jgi:hypothetical protein